MAIQPILTELASTVTVIVTVGDPARCPMTGCNTLLAESVMGVAWFKCRNCKTKVTVIGK